MRSRCSGEVSFIFSRQRGWRVAFVAGVALSSTGGASAQSIRDTVRDHVTEGLEQKQRAPEKRRTSAGRKKSPKGSATRSTRLADSAPGQASSPAGAESAVAENAPAGEKLPKRVFGRNLELDVKVGAGFRGWYPEQYPLVSVAHAGFFTWSLDLKAKLFKFLRLHRGYYESNGLKAPRTRGAVIARDVGQLVPKAAWLLGTLGIPLSRRWETLVSYEARSFVTRARPSAPVAIVSRETAADADLGMLPRSAQALELVSGFETLVLGVRYFPERGNAGLVGDTVGPIPPMYLGVGFTQYSKPYQVKVGNDPLDELLFDGRFRGAGIAYGLSTARQIDRPYFELDAQLGLGEVSLLDDLTLNELLPEDWLIGYLQGDATVGYVLPLLRTRPSLLLTGELSVGGATFFYFKIQNGEAERAPALPLNWDLLWAAHVSLTLPL